MKTKLLKTLKRDEGYTLLELLVVLTILGLLTALATPYVIRYIESGRVKTARTEVANISAALDLYKSDVGQYPSSAQGLDALVKPPGGVDNWNGPYLKKIGEIKDPWGHPYNYRSPGQHGEFDLYSYGNSAKPSNDNEKPEVANW
jgi:general secretion pathway protein G